MKFWNEILNLLRLPNRRKNQNRFETLIVDVDIDGLVYSLIENPDLLGMYAPKSNIKPKKETPTEKRENLIAAELYNSITDEVADLLLLNIENSAKNNPFPSFKVFSSGTGKKVVETTDVLKFLHGWQQHFVIKQDFKRANVCNSLIEKITSNQVDSFLESLNEKKTGD